MFYDFLAKRDSARTWTSLGTWLAGRLRGKQCRLLERCGVLDGRVLEIGPGEGDFADVLVERGLAYRAVERSPGLCRHLEAKGHDVTLASVPPLPFDEEAFDLICAFRLLEHMPTYNDAIRVLEECHRVLAPDGAVVLVVPDAIRSMADFYNWDYTHSFVTTRYRVRQILTDCEFEILLLRQFAGMLTGPARIAVDLLNFIIHSRFIYWLGTEIGCEMILKRLHKTFEIQMMVVARKSDAGD